MMKQFFWKFCVLAIALTMLLTAGAFAEGTIGIVALGLYGLSTVCGIQWACAKVLEWEQPRQPRRAPRRSPAPQPAESEKPLRIA